VRSIGRTRAVAASALILLVASVPGILNVIAKDRVSTAEGVIAWISLVAFVAAVVTLIALAGIGVRRFTKPSSGSTARETR
jgi:uncharacterized membrane protein YhaH (DUF805 family)